MAIPTAFRLRPARLTLLTGRTSLIAAITVAAILALLVLLEVVPRTTVYQVAARTEVLHIAFEQANENAWSLDDTLVCHGEAGAPDDANPCGWMEQLAIPAGSDWLLLVDRGTRGTIRRQGTHDLEITLQRSDALPIGRVVDGQGGEMAVLTEVAVLIDRLQTPRPYVFRGDVTIGQVSGPALPEMLLDGTAAALETSLIGGSRYKVAGVDVQRGDLLRFGGDGGGVVARGVFVPAADGNDGLTVVASAVADHVSVDRFSGHGFEFKVALGDRLRSDPVLQWLILAIGVAVSVAAVVATCVPANPPDRQAPSHGQAPSNEAPHEPAPPAPPAAASDRPGSGPG